MKRINPYSIALVLILIGAGIVWFFTQPSTDQMLALVTYTAEVGASNPADGLALIELNPNSEDFGKIVQRFEMGVGIMPHHLYYSPDREQLFTTSLGGTGLYSVDMDGSTINGVNAIDTGTCVVGEDLYFSEDGKSFYLTCMGSDEVVKLDRTTFQVLDSIKSDAGNAYVKYPHGIGVSPQVDRMIVTETISPDLSDPGSSVSVIEYSSGKVLSTHVLAKVAGAPSAPVEAVFLPDQPIAYITGMLDASLWVAAWNPSTEEFDFSMVDDPAMRGHTWPLEPYIGPEGYLYISYAQPGIVDVYSIEDPKQPKYLRSLPAEAGAHHMLFSSDDKYTFIQNNLLGLEGMNAGTITVVETSTGKLVRKASSFLELSLQPTSMTWLKQ